MITLTERLQKIIVRRTFLARRANRTRHSSRNHGGSTMRPKTDVLRQYADAFVVTDALLPTIGCSSGITAVFDSNALLVTRY